jgi:hypothetical protein
MSSGYAIFRKPFGSRRTWRVETAALVLAVGMLIAGCANGPPQGTGDPGHHRLHSLLRDPMLTKLPPHSQLEGPVESKPAIWDDASRSWTGPAVTVRFTSSSTIQEVFNFYAGLAANSGWRQTAQEQSGLINGWTKQYRGYGTELTLFYNSDDRVPPSAITTQPYEIFAGADPIVKT